VHVVRQDCNQNLVCTESMALAWQTASTRPRTGMVTMHSVVSQSPLELVYIGGPKKLSVCSTSHAPTATAAPLAVSHRSVPHRTTCQTGLRILWKYFCD
jgi:hypothetical protein